MLSIHFLSSHHWMFLIWFPLFDFFYSALKTKLLNCYFFLIHGWWIFTSLLNKNSVDAKQNILALSMWIFVNYFVPEYAPFVRRKMSKSRDISIKSSWIHIKGSTTIPSLLNIQISPRCTEVGTLMRTFRLHYWSSSHWGAYVCI